MQRRWQATDIQQPPPAPLDHVRERLDDGSFEQVDRRRGGAREHDIARHVTPLRFADAPQGTPPFERGEDQKRATQDEGCQHAPPGRAAHEAAISIRFRIIYARSVRHFTHGPDNIEGTALQVDMVTSAAAVELRHLDNLWIQVSGTRCNIECRHCFNNSGPSTSLGARPVEKTFGLMTLEAVNRAIAAAAARGVREIYFTGGEPFLHAQLLEMVACALTVAPTTVLTNGMLISDRMADRLADLATAARYSLEVRVSLDGYTEQMNDAIRGPGVFRLALAGAVRLARRNLLPVIPTGATWDDADE